MLIKKPPDIPSREITDPATYLSRRSLIKAALGAGSMIATGALVNSVFRTRRTSRTGEKIEGVVASTIPPPPDQPNSFEEITSYNNFYEFATDKYSPADEAKRLKTRPWTVTVEGECAKPKVFDVDELTKLIPNEERIYRFRCVEGWSMVIPWVGFPLGELLRRVEPTSRAQFVELTTLFDPAQMPNQKHDILDWPYVEGLRLDEAMHPLTLLAVGLYGETLPNQNGAPIRLVVPWKYGFKSIKSVVKIRLVEKQPRTTWEAAAPSEYGFFSNVNPKVPHPRWSQAKERRIGEIGKRDTLLFNGYAAEVASLYTGMDLERYF